MPSEGDAVACPHCPGTLEPANDPQAYRCNRCGRVLRRVVVEQIDSFQRVAESGGPAAEIAKAALEGVDEHGGC